jgi:hypothetical protein
MKLKFLPVTVLTLLASCGDKYVTADEGVYFQDFDNVKMWARDQWNLSTEQKHSGDYAAFTDSTHEYSQTFEMGYSYAKSKGYKAIKVSAWIFSDAPDVKAGLVTSVESSAGSSAYESADFKNFIQAPKEWTRLTTFFKLPENAPDDAKIKVYVWAPKRQKSFMDDIELKFVK